MPESIALRPDDALVVVDVQYDFLPGGALAVADGDAILPAVGALMRRFGRVVLTQDWHPAGHASFAASHPGRQPFESLDLPYGPQTLWPVHCVQGSPGAALHASQPTDRAFVILRKGANPSVDSYSAFTEADGTTTTGLAAMLRGDPGQSSVANMPVRDIIAQRLPNSLMLAGMTAVVAVPLALVLGIVAAIHEGTAIDRALNIATISMVAMPEFLVATLGVLVFSVDLMWLPAIALVSDASGPWETLRSCLLPVMCLTVVVVAQMARMTRAAIADQLGRPYVEMARLKGMGLRRIVLVHVMPNAIGPVVNAAALSLSYLMGGAIVVETIFSFPGLASLMVNAVTSRDMPLLQACAMIFCAAYLLLILIADIAAMLADPRLRAQ